MDGKERTVSAFEHENSLMHYGMVNKRSMIMLISVCVTFVLITLIFVIGYTIRERNWLSTITQINAEVAEKWNTPTAKSED
jgi:hypothetical protein